MGGRGGEQSRVWISAPSWSHARSSSITSSVVSLAACEAGPITWARSWSPPYTNVTHNRICLLHTSALHLSPGQIFRVSRKQSCILPEMTADPRCMPQLLLLSCNSSGQRPFFFVSCKHGLVSLKQPGRASSNESAPPSRFRKRRRLIDTQSWLDPLLGSTKQQYCPISALYIPDGRPATLPCRDTFGQGLSKGTSTASAK